MQFASSAGPVVAALMVCAWLLPPIAGQRPLPAGGEPPAPSPGPGPGRDEIRVTGRERLVWDQPAASVERLEALGFVAFVDGSFTELPDVTCASEAGPEGFECHSPLPDLTPGSHVIEVAAYVDLGYQLQGPRSSPIYLRLETVEGEAVTISRSRATAAATPSLFASPSVLAPLSDPTDLAVLPDGRVLVSERSGRLLLYGDGGLVSTSPSMLPDLTTGDGRGLLAVAVDATVETSPAVYLLYTTPEGLTLARFSLRGDALGSRAVVLHGMPVAAVRPRAAIRVGPDQKLYLALDDGGESGRARDLGSLSGKVLRLNPDGTTPVDQPLASAIRVAGLHRPTGVAWSDDPAVLWTVDRNDEGPEQIHATRGFSTTDAISGERASVIRFALPPATGASAIVFYDHDAMPAFGPSLLVAGERASAILRLALGPSGDIVGTEWLLRDQVGAIRALAVGVDGAVYACTEHALVRLDPAGR